VIAIADNDEPGRQAVQKVAQNASEAGARSVRIVTVPQDWPEGWDIADPLPDGVTIEDLRRMINEAPEWRPPCESERGRADAIEDAGEKEVPAPQWPEPLGEAAYHGLAGEVVRAIEPHTEADPVALLIQFLVAFGNVVGRVAHYRVESTDHHMNLFAVLVGATSKGRKVPHCSIFDDCSNWWTSSGRRSASRAALSRAKD